MEIDDMQNKLLVTLCIAGTVGGVAGLIVGIIARVPLPLTGAIDGAIIIFPLGGYVIRRQRRWVGMAFLNGLMVVTVLMLGWAAAGVAALASFLTFFIAAGIVRCWYDDNDWKALISHFEIAIGLNHGFQIVDEGKVTLPKNLNIVLGPRNLFIKPYNAVILERGAKQTHILGPSRWTTAAFEYVKYIFDLKEITDNLIIDRIPTQDPINIDVQLCVTYGIDIDEAARLGDRPLNSAEKRALRQLSMRSGDWKEATRRAIKSSVRQITCGLNIHQLLTTKDFARMESRILHLTNHRLRPWHIRVSNILIERIDAPPEFEAAQTEQWVAKVEAGTVSIRDRGRAAAYREALRLIATAYQEARNQGMDTNEIYRELLRRTIEQLSGDPSVLLFAPMLKDLMDNLNHSQTDTANGHQ